MSGLFGEFLGTTFLIILGGGVVATALLNKSKGKDIGYSAITAGWGLAVFVGIFVAQSAGSDQADINPAVTFAKFLIGNIYTAQEAAAIMGAELLGAFTGAVLVWLMFLPHWKDTDDAGSKLAVYCTSPAIRNNTSNFLSEVIGTTVLILGVGAIFGHATMGHPVTGLGPFLVGVLVWGICLCLGGPTGAAINPARDLGPRIAHAVLPIPGKQSSDWGYAWIPIAGPMAGGLLGAVLWKAFF